MKKLQPPLDLVSAEVMWFKDQYLFAYTKHVDRTQPGVSQTRRDTCYGLRKTS